MPFLCWSGCGWPRRVVFIFGKPFMFGGRKKILIRTLDFFFTLIRTSISIFFGDGGGRVTLNFLCFIVYRLVGFQNFF